MFSKACEYGIKATAYVALQSLEEKRASLMAIANEINSPVAFTAKILQQLTKDGILYSIQGPNGGYNITKSDIDRIKLSDVVYAIDGDSVYEGCALGFEKCNSEMPCPLHKKFIGIRQDLKYMLENTSLFELATEIELGLTYLNRLKKDIKVVKYS